MRNTRIYLLELVVLVAGLGVGSTAWAQSVVNILWTPATPAPGTAVDFTVQVSNPGPVAPICVKLETPGGTPPMQTHPGIGIRVTPPINVKFGSTVTYASPGTYEVVASTLANNCVSPLPHAQHPKRVEKITIHGQPPGQQPVGRPDLTIQDWWARNPQVPGHPGKPGEKSHEIERGQRYYVCFQVANIGSAPSGPFTVQGGGLGITFNPTQAHASLAPGETRIGCLEYPTTPPPGTYNLALAVDVPNTVVESDEGNNTRTEPITILP